MPDIVFFNGSYLDRDQVRISPDDRGFLFADGIYEVVRFYGGRPFELPAHLARMVDGLRSLQIDGVEASMVQTVCSELIARNELSGSDALLYLQITRGVAPRVHHYPDEQTEPTVYATVRPFTSPVDPTVGVPVITAPDHRWTRCDIKTVALLPNCMAAQEAHERGAFEAVLVRDGVALEGTKSSFFGVIDGEVRTAPRSNYILPSVTRAVTLELCREHGIPCDERPILLEELDGADELFLSGTTAEILPIIQVDGRQVRDGRPGPIALRLAKLFRARTESASR
jgi:D-alanine transaminase